MFLGEVIKEYRDAHNLTMQEFSDISGLSKPYVSQLEHNCNPKNGQPIIPSLDTFNRVANAIGISFDELISKIDEYYPNVLNDIAYLQTESTAPSSCEKVLNINLMRDQMRRLHMGNKELSIKASVPLRTVNNILSGSTANPTVYTLFAITESLNLTINDVISAEETDSTTKHMDIRTLRLREAFYRSGITQTELCTKANINKGAFSSYLSGRYFPKSQTLEKLSKVLDVSISYLMGIEDDIDPFADQLYSNIKRLRIAMGMSQYELARLTGYTDRSSIAKIENGQVDLSLSKIRLFANVLHATPGELISKSSSGIQSASGFPYDDKDWTDDELHEIELFKHFLLSKRK